MPTTDLEVLLGLGQKDPSLSGNYLIFLVFFPASTDFEKAVSHQYLEWRVRYIDQTSDKAQKRKLLAVAHIWYYY